MLNRPGGFLDRKLEEESRTMSRRISIRWKVLQAFGAVLIMLGLCVEWPPPQEASLPDTPSFLIVLGGLLGAVGLLAAFRRE
jgi:Na+/proline symporter